MEKKNRSEDETEHLEVTDLLDEFESEEEREEIKREIEEIDKKLEEIRGKNSRNKKRS